MTGSDDEFLEFLGACPSWRFRDGHFHVERLQDIVELGDAKVRNQALDETSVVLRGVLCKVGEILEQFAQFDRFSLAIDGRELVS